MIRTLTILVFITTMLPVALHAQTWKSYIYGTPSNYDLDKSYTKLNKLNYIKKINELQKAFVKDGYIATGIDSIIIDDSLKVIKAYLYVGNLFSFSRLKFDSKNEAALNSSGFHEKLFSNKPFNPFQISKLFERVLIYYENSGYPFASVKLDSIQITDSQLESKLVINKGLLFRIDSIHIKGGVENSSQSLYNIIQVTPDDIYNQSIINQIDTRIKETPYLQLIKPTEFEFANNNCNIFIYVKNKPASNFNGIIGVQPDNNGKINITGDVRIKLINALHKSEKIEINWRKMQNLTQNLKTAFLYPYLFNTNFGTEAKFNLYKRDTSFINIEGRFGFKYLFSSNNSLSVFYENKNSNLLSTKQYEFSTTLPEFADISHNSYGIEFEIEKLNYRYNPTKGFYIHSSFTAGNKTIRKNSQLNQSIYENINLKTVQFGIKSELSYYFPIQKKSTIKLSSNSGIIVNENMFTNELYRIGGNRILRGFDEESIYASSFSVGTLEYRFLLEQNSNIFAFIDAAWYENQVKGNFVTDTPIGTGVGINFSTKPGIFSLSYALGSQLGNSFLFRAAKIHFGFVSFF